MGTQKTKYISNSSESYSSHCQLLLTGFIQIFSSLFPCIKAGFRNSDCEALGNVLLSCVQIPIDLDMEGPNVLSPVHAVTQITSMIIKWQESNWRTLSQAAMDVVKETELLALGPSPSLIPEIFEIYFKFVKAAFHSRAEKDLSAKFRDRLSTLGESAAEHIGDFFHASAASAGGTFPLDNILPPIVETLQAPLKHKVPS